MAEFTYVGVNKRGVKVEGRLDADNEGELRMMLRSQGIRPIRIKALGLLDQDIGMMLRGGKPAPVGKEAIMLFTRQLYVLISSGVPVVQSLDILIDQTQDRSLRKIVALVKGKVQEGSFLFEALAQYPESFSRLYVALLRAGESAGALDKVLNRLAAYLEKAYKLGKTVKAAMMYPFVVVSVGIGVVAAMLVFVIPRFQSMLASTGKGELPGPTLFVIGVSEFLQTYILEIMVAIAAVFFIIRRYLQSKEGKAIFDRVLLKTPLFGPLSLKAAVARFARTLSTLLSAGVNLLDALDICRIVMDNVVLEREMLIVRKEVEHGETLGSTFRGVKAFPKLATQLIVVGESTGNLEGMLERVADIYESDVETMVGGMSKLLEPIIIVFLGIIVLGILIAMYLPIFSIADSI